MPTCGVGKVAGLSAIVGAPMAMLCCTGVAGSKLVSPAWLAVTTQVPTWSKRTLLPVIEQMAREDVTVRRNSRLVALVPFGVGQFQNGQRVLGWTLFGTEVAFATASVVTFFLKQNIEQQFSPSVNRSEAQRLRNLAAQANWVTFGLFAATALGGVAHAQVTFVPEFREVRERALPAPVSMPTGGTLMLRGTW